MLRTPILLTLLAAAAPALADDLPGSTAPSEVERTSPTELRIGVLGGAFDGMGVRRASGGLALLRADWTPRLRPGDWVLAFPLSFDHRQTFGAHLDETVAAVGIEADYLKEGLQHGPLAGFSYTWRPDWPDLYQPDGAGGLRPTNRYTHSRWFAGYHLWSKLGGGRHFRIKARYVQYTYVQDPHYDPTISHVHLVPRDYHEVKLDASYRHVKHSFAWALRLDAYLRQYDIMLSRVANTGGTRASDPLQEMQGLEPKAEVEWRSKPFDVVVGYGLMVRNDPFEGYYSYTGHHPYVEAKGKLGDRFSYQVKGSAKLLTFGPNSKSLTHTALPGVFVPGTDDGRRLWDNRVEVAAALRYRVVSELSLVAEGKWVRRDTNFRDYVPGVYPPALATPKPYNTNYDVRWDYTNVLVVGGLEWKM